MSNCQTFLSNFENSPWKWRDLPLETQFDASIQWKESSNSSHFSPRKMSEEIRDYFKSQARGARSSEHPAQISNEERREGWGGGFRRRLKLLVQSTFGGFWFDLNLRTQSALGSFWCCLY